MLLDEKLRTLRDHEAAGTPDDVKNAVAFELKALISSGQAGRALKVGAKAPLFVLPDTEGKTVSAAELLKQGPIVITFYRGFWCPFCNADLQALEAAADRIRGLGATLVAISPQTPANSRMSLQENKLSFPILSDKNCELANQFGIRWIPSEALEGVYRNFGTDVGAFNGDGSWALPMPARYVIATDGTIAYAKINPNYTHRPEPGDVCPVLEKLKAGAGAGSST
jgi:peroxiredoxin